MATINDKKGVASINLDAAPIIETPVTSATGLDDLFKRLVEALENRMGAVLDSKAPTDNRTPYEVYNGTSIIGGDDKQTTFLCTRKEFRDYNGDTLEVIQFRRKTFITDNPHIISHLRAHPLFNVEIFENEFPAHIRQKFEDEQKELTRESDKYEK